MDSLRSLSGERRRQALNAVQVATYRLRRLYLGDRAGDQIAVAETAVPLELAEVVEALHLACEALLPGDSPLTDEGEWEYQAVELTEEGAVRLYSIPH